jgi:hypothetical protein
MHFDVSIRHNAESPEKFYDSTYAVAVNNSRFTVTLSSIFMFTITPIPDLAGTSMVPSLFTTNSGSTISSLWYRLLAEIPPGKVKSGTEYFCADATFNYSLISRNDESLTFRIYIPGCNALTSISPSLTILSNILLPSISVNITG